MVLVRDIRALVLPAALAWDPAEGDVPWQPDEIALFELVDSVNGTFYELMNISINATAKEIKKEYKKLGMEIHPDKNPETEEQFKQLAAVYAILKDERTRAMYHRVLDEGLPDWRMPAFYDRQVQVVRTPSSMTQLSGILAGKWKKLSDAQKKPYEAKANKAKAAYQKKMEKYKKSADYQAFKNSNKV